MFELNSIYSHDYKEFYYSVRILEGPVSIACRKYQNNQWTEAEVVSFSGGQYMDVDPCISQDGKSMFFASNRPVDKSQKANSNFDIWRVVKVNDEWGEPEILDINSEQNEFYSSITNDGTLYFSSGRNNASGGADIYKSEFIDNKFQAAQKLEGDINDFSEGDVFVSAKGDYLIFDCQGRKEGTGLYISFKKNNVWDTPIFMGKEVNSSGTEYSPVVSPDGKYLFFSSWKKTLKVPTNTPVTYKDYVSYYSDQCSPQNGHPDIYWIDAKIIDKLRNENNRR
jgi:Tol biopolymer transport system component